MIQIYFHSSPEDKKIFFKSVKSADDIWLVSHLEAKKSIQNEFLSNESIMASRSVQRASEYWHWLFTVNCPEWSVVSESLIFVWLEEWFANSDINTRFRDISLFSHFFAQFLPIISASSETQELFVEWLQADPVRRERLEEWYEQSLKFWAVLEEKKSLPRPWLLSVLLKKEKINFGSVKQFFVDLGTDLKQQEAEFLLKISETHPVNILVPQSEWSEEYAPLFSVYKKLIDNSEVAGALPAPRVQAVNPQAVHFSSVVKEAKNAVAQVRNWLSAGVPTQQIALLSPNIEDYWDLLREHLVIEGIPANKNYMAKTISFPYIQSWLSRLHLRREEIQQSDLENYLFDLYKKEEPALSYADFKKNYSYIYEEAAARKQLGLPKELRKNSEIKLSQFVEILYNEWPVADKTLIDDFADKFIQDLGLNHVFSYELWLKYLELLISRGETALVGGDEAGITVANISHADWGEITHALVLGCTQNNLREQLKSPALAQDVFSIENDLGLVLDRVEQTKKEFDLRWFLEKPLQSCFLMRPETDFEGQPQTASSYWLALEKKNGGAVSLVGDTRWDQLMRASLDIQGAELALSDEERAVIQTKLELEGSLATYTNIQLQKMPSLSASGFSKYHECSFKFYADKILKLPEPKVYDLEIDSMYQGQLLHAILEEIGKRGDTLDFSKEDMGRIYDIAVAQVSKEVQAQPFWLLEKERHFQFVMNFLELEKAWRQKFPRTKIIATEASFEGYVGVVDGHVVFSKDKVNDKQFLLRGKIDRVDRDANGFIGVTDYKTSKAANLKSLNNWAENGQFQMPLYALGIEKGLCPEVPPGEVAAANYIFLKDKIKGSGYTLTDVAHELADATGKSKDNITRAEREAVFEGILNEIKTCLESITEGRFSSLPKDLKICITCHWSTVCRAPHLR